MVRSSEPRFRYLFSKDPYEAIRRAYLVETDTESEPFEDPVKTETPESPHTVASPTSLPDSTPPTRHAEESEDSDTSGARSMPSDSTAPVSPDQLTHTSPTLVPFLCRTARMAMRVLPAMSPGLSASIAEVAAMSDTAFYKRFRSSYQSLPSSSSPDLPSRKHFRGTSELVEDDDDDEEEEEEDKEAGESSDSSSESKDAKDEGLAVEDEGPAIGDEGLAAGDEDPAPVVETAVGEPLGLGYEALRHQEIASREGQMPSVFEVGQGSGSVPEPKRPERESALRQPTLTTWIDPEGGRVYIDVPAYPPPTPLVQTPPSPEWSFGSLLVSPAPSIVPSPISSPMIPLTVPSPVSSLTTAETEGFLTGYDRDIGELFTRPVLAWSRGRSTDAQRAALWHAISDTQMENQELRLQIAEKRRAQLDLAEIVDSIRRGQEPRNVWMYEVWLTELRAPRVHVPFPEDPYEAIRQACLVNTDTESEPFEDSVETETPKSPNAIASPTSLPDSTPPTRHAKESEDSDTSGARSTSLDFTELLSPGHPLTYTSPTLVLFLCRTARMAVRVPPAMSPSLSANIAEVAAMSDSMFRKRFRSSYETSPSLSPPDLPLRKHSRGTSELVEDDKEEDKDKEDKEVEESSDFDSENEDERDEGRALGDEGLAVGEEGPVMRVESLGLGGDEVVPEGHSSGSIPEPERPERVLALRQPTLTTWIDLEDGRAYIEVPTYPLPVQTPPSLEWSSGSLPVSPAPSIVPSTISSPMIPLTIPTPIASPATVEAEGFLTGLGAQVEMQGGLIHDHTVRLGEISPALFERYDRDIGELFTRLREIRNEIFS
ncbi:hypothetical protein Tco_0593340 [Tanacetum coccineum]